MSVKGHSQCHPTSGTQANRDTSMWNVTSHDSSGKTVLHGLTMAIKFPSWEFRQITSATACWLLLVTWLCPVALGSVKCVSSVVLGERRPRYAWTEISTTSMKVMADRKNSALGSDGKTAHVISPPRSHPPGLKKKFLIKRTILTTELCDP